MSSLSCRLPEVRLHKPKGLAPRLFFSAYHGANAVAYAQLSARSSRKFRNQDSFHNKAPGVSYCLKLIEVQQNYRNQGIGSALLEEVIRFCEDQRVSSIYGEAKGDVEVLRKWYTDKGFQMDGLDKILLSLA